MTDQLLPRSLFTCPVCGLPKVHYRLGGYRCSNPEHNGVELPLMLSAGDIATHGAEPISYEALKELLSAEMQRRLKELTKPYFEELDSLIMDGDPTGEIESGRLFDRHFPDTEDT